MKHSKSSNFARYNPLNLAIETINDVMGYLMSDPIQRQATDVSVQPVIDFLNSNALNSGSRFYARQITDETGYFTTIKIKQKGPSLLRKIIPKTLAKVDICNISSSEPSIETYDERQLPESELAKLSTQKIRDCLVAGAYASRAAYPLR